MVYFDNAATTRFKPRGVRLAVNKYIKNSVNVGRSGYKQAIDADKLVYETRLKIANFFGDEQGNVIFTENCTGAINLAILGSKNKLDGGNVITTVTEHNSVLRPLNELERDNVIKIKYADGDYNNMPQNIEHMVDSSTKLIIVNHISNVNGQKNNLHEIGKIAKQNKIPFLVDGAQSAGHIKIDMKADNISMLACAGHKGLMGILGSGFLVMNNNIKLLPIKFGGTGSESISLLQPTTIPEAYESGTLNLPAIAGLAKAITWCEKNMDNAYGYIKEISNYIVTELKNIKNIKLYCADSSGVISFVVKNYDCGLISDLLSSEFNIATRSGLHCAPLMHKKLGTLESGTVRISVGLNNSIAEARHLVQSIYKLVQKL